MSVDGRSSTEDGDTGGEADGTAVEDSTTEGNSTNYPKERLDTVSGAVWSDVVAVFIIIATGAAIGGSGPLQSALRRPRP